MKISTHIALFIFIATLAATAASAEPGTPPAIPTQGLELVQPPIITLVSPGGGSTHAVNTPISLQVSADDVNGQVRSVVFLVDGQVIATDNTAPYDTSWTPTTKGTYKIHARGTDDDGLTSESLRATITVGDAQTELLTPIIEPAGGTYTDQVTITISYPGCTGEGCPGTGYCGDDIVQDPNEQGQSEECDGTAPNGYLCTEQCQLAQLPPEPTCGNGVCESGETESSCALDCGPAPVCGDGERNQEFEECDGSAPAGSTCSEDCKLIPDPYCGDGEQNQASEECDDGNTNGQTCTASYGSTCDYCSSTCTAETVTGPSCGDGVCQANEDSNTCSADCDPDPYCGDGSVNQNTEQCDDGSANGQTCTAAYGQTCDYCTASCQNQTVTGPYCGDGTCQANEDFNTCSADCQPEGPVCGDGVCEGDEDPWTCTQDCLPNVEPPDLGGAVYNPFTSTGRNLIGASTTAADVQIRYTTDGSTPTRSSALYTGTFTITSTSTVRAKAFTNTAESATAAQSYVIIDSCELTTGSWSAEQVSEGAQVTLTVETVGSCQGETVSFEVYENDLVGDDPAQANPASATISNGEAITTWTAETETDAQGDPEYYFRATLTTTGERIRSATPDLIVKVQETEPVCGNGQQESGESCDDGNTQNGDGCSSTCQQEKLGTPTITPEGGDYFTPQIITISAQTQAQVRYTLDGTTPTQQSKLYSGNLEISTDKTLKARAFNENFLTSDVATETYKIVALPPEPGFCGDSICQTTESSATCPTDCGAATSCGDGVCEGNEDPWTCSEDCLPDEPGFCGDSICQNSEDSTTCPSDCQAPSTCGNNVCEAGEDPFTCAQDCLPGEPTFCGDGICQASEDSSTCEVDCGVDVQEFIAILEPTSQATYEVGQRIPVSIMYGPEGTLEEAIILVDGTYYMTLLSAESTGMLSGLSAGEHRIQVQGTFSTDDSTITSSAVTVNVLPGENEQPEVTIEEKVMDKIEDRTYQAEMISERIPVRNVRVQTTTDTDAEVTVRAEDRSQATECEQLTQRTYKYFALDLSGIDMADVEIVDITYDVAESWMSTNNIEQEEITLFHCKAGSWTREDARYQSNDGQNLRYEASVNDFSEFAIAFDADEDDAETNDEEEEFYNWDAFDGGSPYTGQSPFARLTGAQGMSCEPEFDCNAWSACTQGDQSRQCSDTNSCVPDKLETRECAQLQEPAPTTEEEQQETLRAGNDGLKQVRSADGEAEVNEEKLHSSTDENKQLWIVGIITFIILVGAAILVELRVHKRHEGARSELQSYLQANKSYSKEDLKNSLVSAGWNEDMVDEEIRRMQ